MIQVKKEGILLESTALRFESEGVLNPAAIRVGDEVHMLYRALSKGNYSSIGYCRLDGPLSLAERHDFPVLFPQHAYESHGIEDPRITSIDSQYYLTYTAYDGVNALGALATSTDLVQFQKHGILVPQMRYEEFKRLTEYQGSINEKYTRYNNPHYHISNTGSPGWVWDKNVIFFPRRIHGKLYFLHRLKPDIQIVAVQELSDLTKDFWEHYMLHLADHIVLMPRHKHEVSYIGGGCPPIETEHGWLLIYHGVYDTIQGYIYTACAALLDLDNPRIERARLSYPLFQPELSWELAGETNNVCFPTGAVVFGDTLYIYYGAADERIACASISLSGLIHELLQHPADHGK